MGASGHDVIAGGAGNDRMHGGGGSDIFAFCGDWGSDAVEQLADGDVTLWFESGSSDNWDASSLTYADGTGSVTVSGVTADWVSLKFGDDGSGEYDMLVALGALQVVQAKRFSKIVTRACWPRCKAGHGLPFRDAGCRLHAAPAAEKAGFFGPARLQIGLGHISRPGAGKSFRMFRRMPPGFSGREPPLPFFRPARLLFQTARS